MKLIKVILASLTTLLGDLVILLAVISVWLDMLTTRFGVAGAYLISLVPALFLLGYLRSRDRLARWVRIACDISYVGVVSGWLYAPLRSNFPEQLLLALVVCTGLVGLYLYCRTSLRSCLKPGT